MDRNIERARYDFKRDLEELGHMNGRGTELISLYIPHTRQISDVVAYLRNEYSQSSNIKSKSTKKNVTAAIESIMGRLKGYRHPPDNGLALFVGHISSGGDQTNMVAYVMEPPEPVVTYTYRCDSRFYLEPLQDMLKDKKSYGLIVIDRNEATVGVLKGKRIRVLRHMPSRVMGKHRQGGQSSVRFERLIEASVQNFFQKVGEYATEAFMQEEEMDGVLIGGPGSTKRFFAEKESLHHELRKKVLELVDTGYTDETGLRGLVDNAADVLSDVDMMKEKKAIQRFFREVRKPDGGLSTYGELQVFSALEAGAVDLLLISDSLRKYRVPYTCNCGNELTKTVKGTVDKTMKCPKCASNMQAGEKQDLIDVYYDIADEGGTKILLVSTDTEEGGMLLRAFSGVAAILRYKIGGS